MLESGSAEIEAYLRREGVKLTPKNMILNDGNLSLLTKNKVDATSIYITDEPFYLAKQGVEYDIFYPQSAGIDFYGDILFTTKSFAATDKKLVEDFKRASIKGWEYALANPNEIVDLILKKYASANKTKEQLLFEASQMQKLIKSDTIEVGYLYDWRIDAILRVYEEMGIAARNRKYDLKEFIFENYVKNLESTKLSLTLAEREYISSKKTINVCVDPNWLPMERINQDGVHEGISADILKKVSEKLGLKTKIIPVKNWNQTLLYAESRVCDIVSMAMETKERQKYLTFSEPYFSSPLAIAAKNDAPFIASIIELEGKTLAVVKGYAIVESLRKKYPWIRLIEVSDKTEGLKCVLSGAAYGYIDALASISYTLGKEGWGSMKICAKLDDDFKLSIAVRDDDKILSDILDKALRAIPQKEKDEIFNKWFNVSINIGIDKQTVFKWLAIIAAVVAFLYYQNLLLKKRVDLEIKRRLAGERELLDRSRMAQMGELLDIIAHQWKQPLTAVNLAIANVALAYEYGDISAQDIDNAKKTIEERVAFLLKILDEVRDFLNPNKPAERFDASKAAQEMLDMIKGIFTKFCIDLVCDIEDGIYLCGSKNSYQQVLLSITINAKDIFQIRKIKNPKLTISLKKINDKAVLTIEDNGGGIEPKHIDKIFDYRFTTKEASGGSGIGLYLVKLAVEERLNGSIKVLNTQNGAKFEAKFSVENLEV